MHANEHKGQNEPHTNVGKEEQNRNSSRHQNEQKGINSSNVNQNQTQLTHVFNTSVQRNIQKREKEIKQLHAKERQWKGMKIQKKSEAAGSKTKTHEQKPKPKKVNRQWTHNRLKKSKCNANRKFRKQAQRRERVNGVRTIIEEKKKKWEKTQESWRYGVGMAKQWQYGKRRNRKKPRQYSCRYGQKIGKRFMRGFMIFLLDRCQQDRDPIVRALFV